MLAGVGLLILVAIVGSTAYRLHNSAAAPPTRQTATYRVGECVTLSAGGSGELAITKVDCRTDPSYTVGTIATPGAACPSPTYLRYVWATADAPVGALCLADNLRAGHCYQLEPAGVLDPVDCARSRVSGSEVARRLDNVSDVTMCPQNTTAYAYPIPARTYCLAAPKTTTPV
jgi:hypothetical protein